jgi:hypothetical protein
MFLSNLHHYFVWHYTRAITEWFHIWGNLLWFIVHFFSLPLMVRSWLAPWKRISEPHQSAWDIEEWASSFLINALSRLIGILLRTLLIIIGVITLIGLLIAGTLIALSWVIAPVAIILLLILGITHVM